jgi:hypothetical protein
MSGTDDLPDDLAHDWDGDYCEHECELDGCFGDGFAFCHHEHCMNCGGCRCPGYCDDYQTYNLRPSETGGPPDAGGQP